MKNNIFTRFFKRKRFAIQDTSDNEFYESFDGVLTFNSKLLAEYFIDTKIHSDFQGMHSAVIFDKQAELNYLIKLMSKEAQGLSKEFYDNFYKLSCIIKSKTFKDDRYEK